MLPDTLDVTSAAETCGAAPTVVATAGRYEVIDKVASGGMGTVYKARDQELDLLVALKFLPPHSDSDEMARERLITEAQIASALVHRNVCTVYGIDSTDDGQLFIVMAFYEGQTLKQKLRNGALELGEALELAGQISDGLGYVHARGVVHCDLKPSNLMVTADGVKILDFGLARPMNAGPTLSSSIAPGTVAYAAPEQARGEQTDARTDIWALGAVLYEMLTGRRPFDGAYPEAIAFAIRHRNPPPLRASGKDIPAAVEKLVFKALEKDPDLRFQSAGELARELRAIKAQMIRGNDHPIGTRARSRTIGATIAHYRIAGQLGIGGMGVVYDAEDIRLSRRVALKFVSDGPSDDAEAVRRLRREAEMIGSLSHPHICPIYDTAEHEGRVCIVMERLDGTNLKMYMLRKALETSEILDIAVQITKALEAAHGAGIVHRDIKPGNIFITNTGLVKVLDFGLARRFQGALSEDMDVDGSTIPGRPIGTVNYMAPERIQQLPADPRSDLFSLGVVIYEMATERLPFAGSSLTETLTNLFDRAPVPLRSLSPGRPAGLERIVNKLLAKRPEDRHQSAAELRRALREIRSMKRSVLDRREGRPARQTSGGRRDPVYDDRYRVA
jgi:serine/threonine protein kinase